MDRLCAPEALASFTRMTVLQLDGDVIAAQLDFVTPRRHQGFITTFDAEKHAFISPGRQVQLHLIARAFADGLEAFDLGHGDNLYKHPWMSHAMKLRRRRHRHAALRSTSMRRPSRLRATLSRSRTTFSGSA